MATNEVLAAMRFALSRIGKNGAAREPFLLGFAHGHDIGLHASPAETQTFVDREQRRGGFPSELRSDWVEVYCNGRDDGVSRDLTRIASMMAEADHGSN